MKSLFVHDPADLDAAIPGGVQLCSREFLAIVRAASDEVRLMPVTVTRAPLWRLGRKLGLGSYLRYRPEDARARFASELAGFAPTHVFLNRSELMRLAPLVSSLIPAAKIVILSHGNQSGDDLYEAAGPHGSRAKGLRRLRAAFQLGLDLVTESHFRHRHIHAVCVMSDEEEILERWLGSRRTVVLPRIITPSPIDWRPEPGRVGFVGTLNHTPNRVALEQLCEELKQLNQPSVTLRVVGGPADVSAALAAKYPFVESLGRLDDDDLLREMGGWSLFLNPVFWLSRGASMKLGQALARGLPALTTFSGARGYRLAPDSAWVVEDDARAFAARLVELALDEASLRHRRTALSTRPPSPDVAELAALIRSRLA